MESKVDLHQRKPYMAKLHQVNRHNSQCQGNGIRAPLPEDGPKKAHEHALAGCLREAKLEW